MGKFTATVILVVAIVAGYLAYTGTFFPTGRQYYEVCWEKQSAQADREHAGDPYRDVIWTHCDEIAARVIFASGMLAPPEPEDDQDTEAIALKAACPQVPRLASNKVLAGVQESGGPKLVDAITPADWMIGRIVKMLWPECDLERGKQGYPKIVEIKPGEFAQEQSCVPCEARARRKKARAEELCREARATVRVGPMPSDPGARLDQMMAQDTVFDCEKNGM